MSRFNIFMKGFFLPFNTIFGYYFSFSSNEESIENIGIIFGILTIFVVVLYWIFKLNGILI